jgi:cytochrome bd-type quinol oxidase subunit 2
MDYLPIFIAVTAAAVVLQAAILGAMFIAMRKTSSRVEKLAADLTTKVLPTAELVHAMVTELQPKIESAVTNASEATALVHSQLERFDVTLNDIIDRTRLQVIRADEFVGRTLDRVEHTTEIMHRTVVSPVRQISALMQGLSVGFGSLFGAKRTRRNGSPVPQDEMFI